jgi:hypothetical protein
MVVRVPGSHTEHGGGGGVVVESIVREADGVGTDTLGDVLIHTIELGDPWDTLLLTIQINEMLTC